MGNSKLCFHRSLAFKKFLFAIIHIVLIKEKYFSQSKCDAEDSGCHLINNGLQVVKGEKKRGKSGTCWIHSFLCRKKNSNFFSIQLKSFPVCIVLSSILASSNRTCACRVALSKER